jgi:hypothetical protein
MLRVRCNFPEAHVPPTAAVTADRPVIRLSDTLTVTLSVDGPPPLRVELPTSLLTAETALDWKVEPVGRATLRTTPAGDRWEQVYHLSPFVPGEAVPLAFQPVRVSGLDVLPNPLSIKVETVISAAKADDARPVTEIEPLPPPPAQPPPVGPAFAVGVMAVFVAAVVYALRRRRQPKPVSADEWCRRRLAKLDADSGAERLGPTAFVDGIAGVVRGYVARRFHLTADPLTTPELLAAGDAAGVWAPDTRAAVAAILEACDRVKFAGQTPTPDDCRELSGRVRTAIDNWPLPSPTP